MHWDFRIWREYLRTCIAGISAPHPAGFSGSLHLDPIEIASELALDPHTTPCHSVKALGSEASTTVLAIFGAAESLCTPCFAPRNSTFELGNILIFIYIHTDILIYYRMEYWNCLWGHGEHIQSSPSPIIGDSLQFAKTSKVGDWKWASPMINQRIYTFRQLHMVDVYLWLYMYTCTACHSIYRHIVPSHMWR